MWKYNKNLNGIWISYWKLNQMLSPQMKTNNLDNQHKEKE